MTDTLIRIHVLVASLVIGVALTVAVPAHAQSSEHLQHLLARADANDDAVLSRTEIAALTPPR